MRTVTAGTGKIPIPLGRCGENGVTTVTFDLSEWTDTDGTPVLLYRRHGDAAPYLVDAEQDGDALVWTVSATDTAVPGEGACEVQYISGETVAKSRVWQTTVLRSLGDPSEVPAGETAWVAAMLAEIQAIADAFPSVSVGTDENGLTTVTLAYDDGETVTITDGVGIESIEQTAESTESGGANVWTATMTDGTTAELTVRNGHGIASIERTDGDGSAGTTDTYTITMTDGTTAQFTVYNGADTLTVTVDEDEEELSISREDEA